MLEVQLGVVRGVEVEVGDVVAGGEWYSMGFWL